jgi:hypothetical protein
MSTQSKQPEFPAPFRFRGRLYWRRPEIEAYKRELLSFVTGAPVPAPSAEAVESFVSAEQVTKEFGFGRRTLGRRIDRRARFVESPEAQEE